MSCSVAFVTPRFGKGETEHDWARSALASDTCAIYMGVGEAKRIAGTLLARGACPDLPVVIVENASLPDERRFALPLSDLWSVAALGLAGPAVILFGEVFERVLPAWAATPIHAEAHIA